MKELDMTNFDLLFFGINCVYFFKSRIFLKIVKLVNKIPINVLLDL